MAEDDGIGCREAPGQASQPTLGGAGVVSYRHGAPADLDLRLDGQQTPQRLLVDIAMHGMDDWTELSNLLQRREGKEVAGVDDRIRRRDQLDAPLGQPAGAAGHVGVGEHGDHPGNSDGPVR